MSAQNQSTYWQGFPDTYRTEEVQRIARWVAAGEGGVLIGCSGAGKSNLVGFVATRGAILAHFAGINPSSLSVLHFDINSLPMLSAPYFYRGILHSILQATDGLPPSTAAEIHALVRQDGDWNDAFFALTTVGHALHLVVEHSEHRVILMLDRFDEACRRLDSQVLNSLRSLRDRFKERLAFVVATRHPLDQLRPVAEFDEFYELVAGKVCWVGPMVARDADWIARQMADRLDVTFTESDIEQLIAVTGGLPAFMKAGCLALAEGELRKTKSVDEWTTVLLARPEIERNCHELWNDLEESDQSVLMQVVDGEWGELTRSGLLAQAGLLTISDGAIQLFSPIFSDYILNLKSVTAPNVAASGLHLDLMSGDVVRDGQALAVELTNNEHRLLAYLHQRAGEICTKDEIMAVVWPDDLQLSGVRDDRLAQLVKRLRDKIELEPHNPTYVQTIRGRGYRLAPLSAAAP